jgi:hypothetical protein
MRVAPKPSKEAPPGRRITVPMRRRIYHRSGTFDIAGTPRAVRRGTASIRPVVPAIARHAAV